MREEIAPAQPAGRAWSAIPGPVNPNSFFDEQRRRRRATWRLGAICALFVIAEGIAFSLIVVPSLIAQVYLLLYGLDLLVDVPPRLFRPIEAYGELLQRVASTGDAHWGTAVGIAGIALPGVLVLVLLWLWLHRLFRRAGIGGVLLTLGAREPRADDLEERQLVNVVEEMALAGGIGRPSVVLLDDGPANAAAIGTGPDWATVVVSRRLLDAFDRDETQGTLAHLIGGIGNGDLAVALTLMSALQTFGLASMLINLPISRTSRAMLWRLLRLSLRPGRGDADAQLVASMLSTGHLTALDDAGAFMDGDAKGGLPFPLSLLRWVAVALFFPLLLASIFGAFLIGVVQGVLIAPMLALIWRSRRYLADATAVQLTRNPDSLARGLRHLAEGGGMLRAGRAVSLLFVVGAEALEGREEREVERALAARLGKPAREASREEIRAAMTELIAEHDRQPGEPDPEEEAEEETFERKHGMVLSMHPPLHRRLKRLRKMGASMAASEPGGDA